MTSVLSRVDVNRGDFRPIIPCCVVVAIGKANSSGATSVVYAMKLNRDGCIVGDPFRLCILNRKNQPRYILENKVLNKEKIEVGALLKYRVFGDLFIYEENKKIRKNKHEILKSLKHGRSVYRRIKEACPEAKFGDEKGIYLTKQSGPENCRIFLVSLKYGVISNERLHFGTKDGEHGDLKLNCRENLRLSVAPVFLQMKPAADEDDVGDVALIRFSATECGLRNPAYRAVCEGLILKFGPKELSTNKEPAKIQNGAGKFIYVPGSVKFDTGNDVATGISKELTEKLDLEPDNSSRMRFNTSGGGSSECPMVKIKVKIRRHVFSVNALVGAPAPGTDLLIGQDIIKKLNADNFTVGE